MSWQTPGGDPPPESDTERGRAPWAPAPAEPAPLAQPATTPGLISAAPEGLAALQGPPAEAGPGPVVGWAAPAPPAPAPGREGWVIAGVGARLVAYFIDSFLLGIVTLVVALAIGAYSPENLERPLSMATLLATAMTAAITYVYFVGLWRSGGQASLGMRVLKLRVYDAANGATLSMSAAATRWFALFGVPPLLGFVPVVGLYLILGWSLVLLIGTGTHPLHQGLHDRWATSVVVRPAGEPSNVWAIGCGLALIFGFIVIIIPIVAVILLGDRVQEILSRVGDSI